MSRPEIPAGEFFFHRLAGGNAAAIKLSFGRYTPRLSKIWVMAAADRGRQRLDSLLIFPDAIFSARFRRTPVCRKPVTIFSPFKCKDRRVQPRLPMPTVQLKVSAILNAFEQAQTELVGNAVILTDGKAGTVENIWLDELHGLRISIRGHDGKWPVSTIKFAQSG